MKIPDRPPDLTFQMLTPTNYEEFEFSFQVKKQAPGHSHIQRWGWDEKVQAKSTIKRLREKPFVGSNMEGQPIGTLSLQLLPEFVPPPPRPLRRILSDGLISRARPRLENPCAYCLALADAEDLPVRLGNISCGTQLVASTRRNGFVEGGRITSTLLFMERPKRLGFQTILRSDDSDGCQPCGGGGPSDFCFICAHAISFDHFRRREIRSHVRKRALAALQPRLIRQAPAMKVR